MAGDRGLLRKSLEVVETQEVDVQKEVLSGHAVILSVHIVLKNKVTGQ